MARNSSRVSLSGGGSNKKKGTLNFKLPGIDHRVGSLNGYVRKQEFQDMTRFNLMMAKKLIETKSVVNHKN